ncbi:hypothetical protein PENANT_c014G00937 [Penicillium antarcticum]|uniref:KOW domain-containing protein n=1 Tax=Penicillium antarcticum TaxID=416450 RepID=A0A1V6Q3Z9_9EURO|nr:uncharacterized protein N7508_004572 [Penicillium antarcticum]KAJ5309193.1 hypothetical protein N7508_004572 [Penicillium antarcticum]OQD83993.1 hypothetical protein PENANT_c014G00937 [Penicillium antarcticum]
MQKVIQRTASARKQALRRTVKNHERQELMERLTMRRQRKDYGVALYAQHKAARQNRWEDWEKGSLAPMRDSGLDASTYGAIPGVILQPPSIPKHLRRKHILFAEGDKVCVMRGRDQGKINVIQQVNRESETVIVKDVNMYDVIIPEWAKSRMGHQNDTQAQNFPIPMDDIRHVIPLEDTDTGETKLVIVDHAYAAGPYNERAPHSKLPRHSRYVSGLNIEIPWPVEEEPPIADADMDTLRVEVETSTFVPTLREPPFPSTIIDELRNKYSKFRTRHDPEYVQEKLMEDYRKEYRETVSMMTPKTDSIRIGTAKNAERRKAMTDEDGKMRLSETTQAFINSHLEESWKNSPKEKAKGKRAHVHKA